MMPRLKAAFLTAFVAAVLALPLAGARTVEVNGGLTIEGHFSEVLIAVVLVFFGRLILDTMRDHPPTFLREKTAIFSALGAKMGRHLNGLSVALILLAVVLPFLPFTSRYALDVSTMALTYVMLAWGLNITVGYAGLLDLGYVGFYALGAYSYALLSQAAGIGFWMALPIAGTITAVTAFFLGFPVLRLRGDYFAIVTLGFGEIVRLFLINWTTLTGGPNGISGVPRPSFLGLDFARVPEEGHRAFHSFFGLTFDPLQRVIFLYYLILVLALAVGAFSARLRRLPLGRAWEAFREDEIACAALGINRWWIKLAAYSLGAMVAGLAGAFFATRQGFVSPESFTFTESATVLAIVILGGVGHPLGIALAALFIIGLPELFRGLEQYRMVAFGLGMVLIMLVRPGGLMDKRQATVLLEGEGEAKKP